jgi:enoyl-CoA hydratase/carnithine racemase
MLQMSYATKLVQINLSDGVLTISLNRPEKQNALTQEMYFAMVDSLKTADSDDSVKVVVLTGVGPHFTAGNDIGDFLAADAPIEEVGAVVFLRTLSEFTKPVIAKVRGNAVGIGTTCLLHCDLVYCDETATFAMPFTQLGLCPEAGASLLLPRLMGHHKASELLLTGKRFGAHEADDFNMLNGIIAVDELDDTVTKIAATIARLPEQSVRLTKALLKTDEEAVSDRMGREFKQFETQLHSDTARAIFQQFLNK